MVTKTRYLVFQLFKVGAGGRIGWYIDMFIMVLILMNVVAVMLETVGSLYAKYFWWFIGFEALSVAVFSIEYLGRIWTATEHGDYEGPIRGRLRFMLSPFMLIDLLAILPFFVGVFVDLRYLRALRLFRFFRLFKLTRYSEALQAFSDVLSRKREDLIITSSVGVVLLLISSSLMYFIERSAQPEVFSSIPAALWWGIITLTTVGYGDVHPVTPLGKVLGGVIAIIGIGLFALPASILASGFLEVAGQEPTKCPNCGKELEEDDLV